MQPYIRSVLSCLLSILFFLPAMVYAVGDTPSILIICSYNPAAHQTSVTISDFMDEYTKCGGQYNIEIENMNCKSFSESTQWKGMMQQILGRYTGVKRPEMIVLLGQEAWAAYLSQEDSLVSRIPVMCSLTSRNVVLLPEDTTHLKEWMPETVDFFSDHLGNRRVKSGFVYDYDIESNVRLILHFYPETRHIAFISDNSYGGVAMQALVREEMKKFPELDLILLDGRSNTIYSIMERFHQLPENTVAMVGTWRVDMNESYFMRNATYMMMEANPSVPAFAPASVGMGYWTIGGVMPSYRPLGRDMAREAIRMFDHPNDTTFHVEVIGSKTVLDYKKVKELKLDVKSLPFDVEIVNQPLTFYQQYTYQIWAVFVILVLLGGGFLVSLFFYIRTKRLKDDLEKSEVDLREAKDRAEESNRLKSAFLANMSHEIRTPLNAIVGFSDVLTAEGVSDEERESYSDIIKSNSDLLLRLINDILDLSRLEADRVQMAYESCDVVQLSRQVLTSVDFSRKSKNKFVFTSNYESFVLTTDVQRLQQVIINLLSNAAKFTQDGTITLDLSVDEARSLVLFSVSDTGCGIPKEKQKLVFERFEKLNEHAQGTGLGLSICKLTVEKWGGEIWVDPDYTDGARFVFSMPIRR